MEKLFNISHLKVKTKVRMALIRDMLFDNATAVNTHTEEQLQSLMDCISQACQDFNLTISLKRPK